MLTIGRTPANAIRLHDTEVSREHAQLVRKGEAYVLRDLHSSNGSFINGQQISEQELVSGDQVQLGRSRLLFTGFTDENVDDIASQVDIVARANQDDGSRIVSSLSQSGNSEWMLADAGESSSPWLARARSNLQIMYRTALAVSHTMDIDQLLARIMEMIFDWVDADRGCIMLKDETGTLLPKVRRHRRGISSDEKITISKTILDYVVDKNEGVLTSNARDDKRWDPAQSIVKLGVREAICVPMQGRYDVVGVIYIDTSVTPQRLLSGNGGANQFSEEHLRLMIAMAHQAALAVEDTSYYKALVQAERLAAIGQTIASLSHHIKNILQGVQGGSYLIELGLGQHDKARFTEDGPDAAASEKAVSSIRKGWGIVERNQERISNLVMDMLTFSKERVPEPCPTDINQVLVEVHELMQLRASDAGVELLTDLDESMPEVMVDPESIHRAVLNLATNAIDACDGQEQARVTVSSRFNNAESRVLIHVEDNGAGIAPEDVENIFNVFVSGKGSRGTGLGLSVTQKIVEEHGGRISVESEPGSGSRFEIDLPAAVAPQKPSNDAQRATQSIPAPDLSPQPPSQPA